MDTNNVCSAFNSPECTQAFRSVVAPWAVGATLVTATLVTLATAGLNRLNIINREATNAMVPYATTSHMLFNAAVLTGAGVATAYLIANAILTTPLLLAIWLGAGSTMVLNTVVHLISAEAVRR